ncbi:trehalose-phosphatase [Micromonospora sp. NPDC092111]|uniref:trehalose-phosphatase n=1 Tax=Micromonospora sp. NPDC092111 TaxID=3364289 RepID=UPI00380F7311
MTGDERPGALLRYPTVDLLIAADLDGTLIPPTSTAPDWQTERDQLPDFCRRLGAAPAVTFVCVTGRRAQSARRVLGAPTWVVGLHGAESLAPYSPVPVRHPVPDAVTGALAALAAELRDSCPAGMQVEDKQLMLTIHHPGYPPDTAAHALAAVTTRARDAGLRQVPGRGWTELRPPSLPDKGDAVLDLVRRFRPRRLAVAGDDHGDGPMFRAARALARRGTLALAGCAHVRTPGAHPDTERLADVVVDSPAACRAWLLGLATTTDPPGQRRPDPLPPVRPVKGPIR